MPVTHTLAVETRFGASHVLEGHPTCGRVHGHTYDVRLVFGGTPSPSAWGQPATGAIPLATAVVGELANRHLNDMIPAGFASPSGIAAYLLERCTILGVVRVEVHEHEGFTAAAERD